ncbi:hypothetical protein A3K63_03445 [Candidatus Micrarchaeota archaeon RBG_16_49_10]|nr:MAG: hypothetical protein A3K63_03445 [Candidatus Micrarchaeota archaeon RBG_16_49_10]
MKVLFVCVANVGRSQMAEAFFNGMSKKNTASSAGTKAERLAGRSVGDLSDKVTGCMAEAGYDVSKNRSKTLTPKMVEGADIVVSMAEKETWPGYLKKSRKVRFWEVEDGKDMPYEFHCRMRDKIKGKVEELVKEIG